MVSAETGTSSLAGCRILFGLVVLDGVLLFRERVGIYATGYSAPHRNALDSILPDRQRHAVRSPAYGYDTFPNDRVQISLLDVNCPERKICAYATRGGVLNPDKIRITTLQWSNRQDRYAGGSRTEKSSTLVR